MVAQMTHWERVRATLAGRETDRVAVSMWRHFYESETSAPSLAEAMLAFQTRFDWDFLKVNPRASYHVEGWGVKLRYQGTNPPEVIETPIREPSDWLRLEPLKPDQGVLKEHLDSLEIIADGLKGKVPFLMTVFTPLSIASRLVHSEELFWQHLQHHTEEVRHALEVVTETFTNFAKACLERGACGLFYATTAWATSERMSAEEYRRCARPYDLQLLLALPQAEFHILHVCRSHNLLETVADYPVRAFNWDVRGSGNASLAEGKRIVGGRAVIGGISHGRDLVDATPQQLAAEITALRTAMGNHGWMLGPGCTFPPDTPELNLDAIRQAVEIPTVSS
jgi:uroporphyrinogen decarboxylase